MRRKRAVWPGCRVRGSDKGLQPFHILVYQLYVCSVRAEYLNLYVHGLRLLMGLKGIQVQVVEFGLDMPVTTPDSVAASLVALWSRMVDRIRLV